jgi:hypothetical protein
MLDKVIMLPFSIFLIFLFVFLGVIGIVMFGQWAQVQNEAQFLATSMGKWGGYTEQAEQSVQDFAQQVRRPRSDIAVRVSEIGPAPWGKPMWVRVTVPFDFRLGNYNVGTYQLTGLGRSLSSYLGGYNVDYVSP